MIFLDTSFFIAAARKEDAHHEEAARIAAQISGERLLTTDHVLGELITFLMARDGPQKAGAVARELLDNRKMEIAYCNENQFSIGVGIAARHRISMCDALSVAVMEENNLSKIVSFDSDFDKVRGIIRIH